MMDIKDELRKEAEFAHKVTGCSLKNHIANRAADEIESVRQLFVDLHYAIMLANIKEGVNEVQRKMLITDILINAKRTWAGESVSVPKTSTVTNDNKEVI
jgi:hypothetical protein